MGFKTTMASSRRLVELLLVLFVGASLVDAQARPSRSFSDSRRRSFSDSRRRRTFFDTRRRRTSFNQPNHHQRSYFDSQPQHYYDSRPQHYFDSQPQHSSSRVHYYDGASAHHGGNQPRNPPRHQSSSSRVNYFDSSHNGGAAYRSGRHSDGSSEFSGFFALILFGVIAFALWRWSTQGNGNGNGNTGQRLGGDNQRTTYRASAVPSHDEYVEANRSAPRSDDAPPPYQHGQDLPSGTWGGYYSQRRDANGSPIHTERRDDMRLELHFAQNVVSGSGSDDVGSYQITGRYSSDSRTIAFTKFYNLLNYGVEYRGKCSGQIGLGFRGTWHLNSEDFSDEGRFHVWPVESNGWEDVQDRSAPADCPPQLFDATDDDICVVCFDSQIDTAMLPCGHIAVCSRCCSQLTECPICRKAIARRMAYTRQS